MSTQGPTTKPAPDWELIEREYRAGVKTLRQIAEPQGISHVAIAKRAKRDGWSRDLSARIASKAEELVSKAAVNAAVTAEKRATEHQIVEANATAIVQVRLRHRTDIQKLATTCAALAEELGTTKKEDLPLTARAKTAKTLSDALGNLVALEREAFGIKADAPADAGGLASLATTELQRLLSKLAVEEGAQ